MSALPATVPSERRATPRVPVDVYFNKYIDGQPFMCEAIELSTTGMLVRKIHEPDAPRACYAVEIASMSDDGERIWLCATPVWTDGKVEALGFVGQSDRDKERIAKLLEPAA